MKKNILRHIKFYLAILLSLSVYDFLLLGTNFIYRLPFHLLIALVVSPVLLMQTTKLKHLRYDENSITYKKKNVKYSDINEVGFRKFMDVGSISIKYSKKKYLNLSFLPFDIYQELKEIILEKANPKKIKHGNRFFIQFGQLSFPLLIFIFTLFLNQKIPQKSFEFNPSIDVRR